MTRLTKKQRTILAHLRDDPVFFARVIMNFKPYKYQRELLQSKSKRIVAVWGRQSGKTTSIAVKVIHYAYTHPNSNVIIVSKGLRQSMIMFSAITQFVRGNSWLNQSIVRSTRTQIYLKNGSKILALPCSSDGANLRGHTAHMVIMDEAAFMNETVISQVIFPMLATTGGIAIMLSTPWGRNHIFYRSYSNPKFWVQRVKSRDCPSITKEFLDEQRELIGDLRYQLEYEAEFIEDQNAYFTQDIIRRAIELYSKYEPYTESQLKKLTARLGGNYFVGVDLGKRFDHSVIIVLKQVEFKLINKKGEEETISPAYRLVYMKEFDLGTEYREVFRYLEWLGDKCFLFRNGCADQTGVGEAFMEYVTDDMKYLDGVWLSSQEKQAVAQFLYTRLEADTVAIPFDKDLIAQMNEQQFHYGAVRERVNVNEKGVMLFSHPEGRHDDKLWALALAVYATRHRPKRTGIVR